MHGIRRVIVFCTLTTVLPTMLLVIPLYLRHSFYASVAYAVTESDILEISDGISTIFCSEHTLQMNGTFNAFQMSHKPEVTSSRKHIRLKKSMNLPDDTLEYWGFYLLKGATVALSVCSRFEGASILVVKGERNLRTCGMLEHNNNKGHATGVLLPETEQQVKIIFETHAQEINSGETGKNTEVKHEKDNNKHSNTVNEREISLVKNVTSTDSQSPSTDVDDSHLETLYHSAKTYLKKYTERQQTKSRNNTERLRHDKSRIRRLRNQEERKAKRRAKHLARRKNNAIKDSKETSHVQNYVKEHRKLDLKTLSTELVADDDTENLGGERETEITDPIIRTRRSQDLIHPPSLLDQGIIHGGNAGRNASASDEESSISSFENGLLNCYKGEILLTHEFEPSDQCVDVDYLVSGKHMQTRHDVVEDGYYYYIFYSDNDFVSNDIHALFDIYKPTFQYENVTRACVNQTECSFSLGLMSSDRVIVEIPTKDGIDHELDDISLLVSICHPRMGIYAIFPIAVLFLILGCAFM